MKKMALLLVSILLASCQGGTSSSSAFTGNSSSSTQDESSLSQPEAKMTRVEAMNTLNSYRKHIGEESFQVPNKVTLSSKETIDGEKDTFHAITTSTYQWGICNTDKPDLREYSQLG